MRFIQLLAQSDPAELADSLATGFKGKLKAVSSMTFDEIIQSSTESLIHFGLKLLLCFVVIWLGKKMIHFIINVLKKIMNRRSVDLSVSQFLSNLMSGVFWLILFIVVVNILGINTSTFVALFASAGLAFGMALSGTLQNFAGGVMILLFKPFRIGDYIEAQGEGGTVIDITITNTVITTPDNKTIYLPNGATFTGVINNYSRQATRRVDWTFEISYGDDYDQAKQLILDMFDADDRVLRDPAPFVALKNLGISGVEITARAWVKSADYWGLFFDINEKAYKTFPKENLNIPFPQMDVHVHNVSEKNN